MWFSLISCVNTADPKVKTHEDTGISCTSAEEVVPQFGNIGQGVSPNESIIAEHIASHLLADPNVAFVYWRNDTDTRYTVHFHDSSALLEWDGSTFRWSPLPNLDTNPLAHSSLQSELDAGENPNGASQSGYEPNDERLSFIPLETAVWPYLEERLAQIFEHPNSPDMAFALAPYSRGGVGSHGGMSLAQSRAPLLMSGPGLIPGPQDNALRHIDIAPTIAHLLGVEPVEGKQLLGQDGTVRQELLQPCAFGSAKYAILITLDGLSHTELRHALDEGNVPQIARIENGQSVWLNGGSIVGWPSFSFPGHISLHMGSYQGHHGILSNTFWDRAQWQIAPQYSLSTLLADPEAAQNTQSLYLSPENESIFEAVTRQFPDAHTASINELAFRGATYSRLADQLPQQPPPPDTLEYQLADASAILQFQNMVDSIGLPKFLTLSLYLTDAAGQNHGPHGDEMREALRTTDAQLKSIFDAYENAGIWNETLFVVTADHGMELQDPTRTAVQTDLNVLNLPIIQVGQMIYFNP
ncbi:MAG: alkaline phosphatase family protein [Myxococcota bacterium]|nr:alkaline phosphatase family protein [Myxococcota bacterium]MEC8380346.1 alkaline phosphatase family protein [Myxococcota bacterium]